MSQTRKSLIFRIRDAEDSHAWSEFVDIYGPLIYRYGRDRGLQDSDAADLSQVVLMEVAKSIGRFEYDTNLGRFRNWLLVIARAKLSNFFKKKVNCNGSGDSRVYQLLHEQPAHDEQEETWRHEYREHLFRWAAEHVKHEVEDLTWQAFWQTAVEEASPKDVSERLGLKVGSVYVAKSRVLVRIRAKIAEVDDTMGQD
ncbi:MAG: sigma-70 family RNA polymerase sigma factor [Planctomycetota bacterium]